MKQKLKSFCQNCKQHVGKIAAALTGGVLIASNSMTAFAADEEAVSAAKSLMETAAGTLNIGNVVAIIGAGIGAVLGLFLAWWGGRKLVRMLVSALKKGKISI